MERDAYFDNAKLLLIFLVVFGHLIQPYIGESNVIYTVYVWVYTFSMPAFIFLSGFFARGSEDISYVLNLVKRLLFPYIIFQVIYTGYYYLIGRPTWLKSLSDPHWGLWFLISLFSWHILLIFFKRLEPRMSMLLSVVVGVGIGYISGIGKIFSLSRTFSFFPFFLLGYWINRETLTALKQNRIKLLSVIYMSIVALVIYFGPRINMGWLLHSWAYDDLGAPLLGGAVRLLVYLLSGLMMFSILAFVPDEKNRLSHLGERTLYVYLLHGFVIQFIRVSGVLTVTHSSQLIGLAALSALIVYVLSSKPVLGISQPFIEGKASILRQRFGDSH